MCGLAQMERDDQSDSNSNFPIALDDNEIVRCLKSAFKVHCHNTKPDKSVNNGVYCVGPASLSGIFGHAKPNLTGSEKSEISRISFEIAAPGWD